MKGNRIVILSIILVSSLMSFFLFSRISRSQLVPWDEGGYLLQAYELRRAFLDQGVIGFWKASRAQISYPFMQSWYFVFTSFFLGFNIESVRLANVLLFIPATVLMWFLSNELIKKNFIMKLIPIFLFVTSSMILFIFSNALKEGFGATLTLLSLWFYFLARRRQKKIFYLLTSLSLLGLFLTKYNYGVLMIAAIAIESGFCIFSRKRRQSFWSFQMCLFGPLAIGFYWWVFSLNNNLPTLLLVLQNKYQVNLYDTTVLGHILYYPMEIAFSYLLTPWLAIFVAIGFLWSWRGWRDGRVRVLTFFFLINLLLAIYHMSNNQARFIFTSPPALFLLAGFGLSFFFDEFRKGVTIILLLFCSFFILKNLFYLPIRVRATGSHQIGSPVFYEKDYQEDWRFDFNFSHWPHQLPTKEEIAGQTIDDVFEFIFSQTNLLAKYTLVGPLNEFSPGLFDVKIALRRDELRVRPTETDLLYYVIIQVMPGSRFDNIDYQRHYPMGSVEKTLQDSRLHLVAQKYFSYLGLKVMILEN